MSATLNHPEDFDNLQKNDADRFGPEFSELMSQPVTPEHVLALYDAMYKKNKKLNAIDDMVQLDEFTQDDMRILLQICNEMNNVEKRLCVTITDEVWNVEVPRSYAAMNRATMLSIALCGVRYANKQSTVSKIGDAVRKWFR